MGDVGMSADTEGQSASERRVAALKKRRKELDVSQTDLATKLALRSDGYFDGVARGTISGYVSKWEQGKTDPVEETLDKYEAALDEIEAEQNATYPACENPECNIEGPDKEPIETDEGLLCEICYYTQVVEPLAESGLGGGV